MVDEYRFRIGLQVRELRDERGAMPTRFAHADVTWKTVRSNARRSGCQSNKSGA